MATFEFKGVNNSMQAVAGKIEANDRKSAISMLKSNGIKATFLTEISGSSSSHNKSSSFGFNKQKIALNFLDKFLLLHSGGLPIGDAVKIMRIRLKGGGEQKIAEAIHKDICEGKTIANAMRAFPDIFSENTVCMIEAGEKTGNLVPTLRNLVEFLKTEADIRKKFISSMAYPITVCVIGFMATIIFLFFVMPRLQKMLTSMEGELPAITKILISSSDFAFQYWWALLIIIVGGLFSFAAYKKTQNGRYNIDKFITKVPVIGSIVKENFYCQLSNLLSTMLGSGINTTEAMSLAENASSNLYFRQKFVEAKKMVLDGVAMTKSFEINEIFPDIGIDLLSVGENTGDLANSFTEVFKVYHLALLEHLKMMTTAITAIAMGAAFVMVGMLALSVVSSVLNMTTSMAF